MRSTFPRDPTLAGDVITPRSFPFRSWAGASGFAYPAEHVGQFERCRSAAEAFFLREFHRRPPRQWIVTVNDRVGQYYVGFLVRSPGVQVAVEVDGMAFHHQTEQQVAGDYLRQRRLAAQGLVVVRFTAREALTDPAECWRQVEAIVDRLQGRAERGPS